MPAGSPRLVELMMHVEAKRPMIDVRDSGPGVDPALGAALFTEGSAAGRRRGIGLALVRQAVERRGGAVDVVNDAGAVFAK